MSRLVGGSTGIYDFINKYFPALLQANSNIIVLERPPSSGYSTNLDESWTNNQTEETRYGNVHSTGDVTFVNTSSLTSNGQSLIGHEHLHSLHTSENQAVHENDRNKFDIESEYT